MARCRGDVKGQKRRWKAKVAASKRARRLYEMYFDFEPHKHRPKKNSQKISRKILDIPFKWDTRECHAAYYLLNKERHKINLRRWRKGNPEGRRVQAHRRRVNGQRADRKYLNGKMLIDKMVTQKGRCVYCRADIKKSYHVDHIMPISLGGDNSPGNIQLLCPACNISKSNLHPIEYANRIGLLC